VQLAPFLQKDPSMDLQKRESGWQGGRNSARLDCADVENAANTMAPNSTPMTIHEPMMRNLAVSSEL
jgi:hypothetical protein